MMVVIWYPYGTNAFKVRESEMVSKYKWSFWWLNKCKENRTWFKVAVSSRSSI